MKGNECNRTLTLVYNGKQCNHLMVAFHTYTCKVITRLCFLLPCTITQEPGDEATWVQESWNKWPQQWISLVSQHTKCTEYEAMAKPSYMYMYYLKLRFVICCYWFHDINHVTAIPASFCLLLVHVYMYMHSIHVQCNWQTSYSTMCVHVHTVHVHVCTVHALPTVHVYTYLGALSE